MRPKLKHVQIKFLSQVAKVVRFSMGIPMEAFKTWWAERCQTCEFQAFKAGVHLLSKGLWCQTKKTIG